MSKRSARATATVAATALLAGAFTTPALADETPTPAATETSNTAAAASPEATGTPGAVETPTETPAPTPEAPKPGPQGDDQVRVATVAFRNGVGTSNPAASFIVEFNDTGQGVLRVVNTSNAHSDVTWLAEMSAIPQGYNLGSPSQGEIASGQALIDAKVASADHVSPDGLYWYIGTLTPGASASLTVTRAQAPAPAPEPDPVKPDAKGLDATPETPTAPAPEKTPDNGGAAEPTTPAPTDSAAPSADTPTGDGGDAKPTENTTGESSTPAAVEDASHQQGTNTPGDTPSTPGESDGAETNTTPSGDPTTPASGEGDLVGVETVNNKGESVYRAGSTTPLNSTTSKNTTGSQVKGQRLKTGNAGTATNALTNNGGWAAVGALGTLVAITAAGVIVVRARRHTKTNPSNPQ